LGSGVGSLNENIRQEETREVLSRTQGGLETHSMTTYRRNTREVLKRTQGGIPHGHLRVST